MFKKLLSLFFVMSPHIYTMDLPSKYVDQDFSCIQKTGIFDLHEGQDICSMTAKTYLVDGISVGYIYYRQASNNPKIGYIFSLKINENSRNEGYGKQLIKVACNDLKELGCKSVEFNLDISNESAQRLLTKLGFIKEPTFVPKVINFKKRIL